MKKNKLKILIRKPIQEVFKFTINPKNTPKWIEGIVSEKTSEWPIKIGTIYRNKNNQGQWSKYSTAALKENELFELISKDKNYHVRYTYKLIGGNLTEMEYSEWVDNGEIEDPFTQDILEKLKEEIENLNVD